MSASSSSLALPDGWASGGRIDGWREFSERVSSVLSWAADKALDLTMSDADFHAWPLGERAVVSALDAWALAHTGTTLHMLLASGDVLGRVHPRWVSWRQTHGHRVHAALAPDEFVEQVPTMLLLGDVLGLRMLDTRLGAGVWSSDRATLHAWREGVDVILQRSTCSLPVTTLGL